MIPAQPTTYFFTNEDAFTANGQAGIWRALSHDEWKYLFEKHLYKYVSVNGKNGIVIAPDRFSGTIPDSYTSTAWASAEEDGFLFLPNTGYRNGGSILETDKSCFYWTSSAHETKAANAYRMFFQWNNGSLTTEFDNDGYRYWAVGIRLVTE